MIRIKPLTLDDGSQVLVEVEHADVPAAGDRASLPPGAEPTGPGEQRDDAMAMLRNSIGAMARNVHASLAEHAPHEWAMELSIGKSFPEAGMPGDKFLKEFLQINSLGFHFIRAHAEPHIGHTIRQWKDPKIAG
jgi:hypothetical protein